MREERFHCSTVARQGGSSHRLLFKPSIVDVSRSSLLCSHFLLAIPVARFFGVGRSHIPVPTDQAHVWEGKSQDVRRVFLIAATFCRQGTVRQMGLVAGIPRLWRSFPSCDLSACEGPSWGLSSLTFHRPWRRTPVQKRKAEVLRMSINCCAE